MECTFDHTLQQPHTFKGFHWPVNTTSTSKKGDNFSTIPNFEKHFMKVRARLTHCEAKINCGPPPVPKLASDYPQLYLEICTLQTFV